MALNGPTSPAADDAPAEEFTGTVENILFRSEDTGYTVCAIAIPNRPEKITIVGHCAAIWPGELLRTRGKWVRHKQHGMQFQADLMECVVPTSARGIERFLASGMIRGIGKVMAKRLVTRFGEDTLRVIEKDSGRLEEVDGIGAKRRQMIKESWIEQKAVRDIMIFLQGHGVGTGQAARIYRQYGAQSIAIITENPYRLCEDVWGVGFKSADRVALSMGIPSHSAVRSRAGLIYVLQTFTDEGHCFCQAPELILQAQALLEIPAEILQEALNHEVAQRNLVREDARIYLPYLYQAEIAIADKIAALRRTSTTFRPIVSEKAVPWAEEQIKITFDERQAAALHMALTDKVSIITGGPGVGKTTIIRALVDIYGRRNLKVCLAAPTGRAAKRMEEATRHGASTIHRLLKYSPRTNAFEHGPGHAVEGDVFILDEVSMIDVPLMAAFLGALPDSSVLVLVGDIDQLPSVGPGNVLRDLIQSEQIPCVKLEHIFRQAHGGLIVQNAHHINRGEFIETPTGDDESDFYFFEAREPEQVVKRLLDLVTKHIPDKFGFDPLAEIQVLTPMRKNELGADNLNVLLQEALNPHGPHVSRFGRIYRVRDRVMQIRNNYDKETFNGDVGLVMEIDPDDQNVLVNFDGHEVVYDFAELDELVHAYACSIHKSQGSEYPAVVLLIATQHFKLLQRNLIYTAITRGRKLVCLVGSTKAVGMAIRNNEMRLRRTGLAQRLIDRLGSSGGAGQRRLEPVDAG
ncbi:MAG: ATP-dependent RecD-like DNA helicase [Lentisphaerae bacterium]|nr:ATP-dependent RecD-like DNA helicase [Lentisphaerota bacterium]